VRPIELYRAKSDGSKATIATVKFEPRDVWIGWFWDRREYGTHHYVCVIPMIVIHWFRRAKGVCVSCRGTGTGYGKVTGGWLETDCGDCDGSGEVSA
jgi:hypothetical protein